MAQVTRPTRVPQRELWPGGAQELVEWLRSHVEVIAEAVEVDLEPAVAATPMRSLAADLLAEDPEGRLAVVEVSLGRSTNSALGRLESFAAVTGARYVIWVNEAPSAEHVAVFEWLNRAGVVDAHLLRAEGVRVGSGPAGLVLVPVVGPSQIARAAEAARHHVAYARELRTAFWDGLAARRGAVAVLPVQEGAIRVLHRTSKSEGMGYFLQVGPHESAAELIVSLGRGRDREAKAVYRSLFDSRRDIEAGLAPELVVFEELGCGRFRIAVLVPGGFLTPEEQWEGVQVRLLETMGELRRVMKPLVHRFAS